MSTVSKTSKPSDTRPTEFILPDLVSHCTFPIHVSRHRKQVTAETSKWFFRNGNLLGKKKQNYTGLQAGLLTSMVYPFAGYEQLRVCNDFMVYLFHLDNLSDDMDNRGTKGIADVVLNSLYQPYTYHSEARLYWKRFIKTGSAGAQQRFIETFDAFFQCVTQQAIDRRNGEIPDLESYIIMRRDTSGCRPCWALIEYGNNLDIPEDVMDHPLLRSMGDAANDLVTWSNDLFSYNVEQARGDTHNMVVVAVDFVGDLCKQSIDRFSEDRSRLPSWGEKIDKDVNAYADGLEDWIVGSLHWSFESDRYFGNSWPPSQGRPSRHSSPSQGHMSRVRTGSTSLSINLIKG
ncbi:isoprenoid synthase domain-containing protein [Flagelloscypha sp. PMI_526]|nr:isoprenoid synthase domain-containing protein [Flagelloscypha sp. PMI_526]